jgi:hypothetical protein
MQIKHFIIFFGEKIGLKRVIEKDRGKAAVRLG